MRRVTAYFFGPPAGELDKACRNIFIRHGGRPIGAWATHSGPSAGEIEIEYELPDDKTVLAREELREAGFRLEPIGMLAKERLE